MVICSSHHHVLAHWRDAVDRGVLPAHGIRVVHFDAHPDLAVPRAARDPRGPRGARLEPDIATFQLAAVQAGLVERVIWLRPDWARQLPDGERTLRLGFAPDGSLRVDDPADYYVLDGAFAPTARLEEPATLEVRVLRLADAAAHRPLARGPVILDVDLDGFATRNPGADALRAAGLTDDELAALRRAFDPARLALPDEPAARQEAVAALEAAILDATQGGLATRVGALWTLWRLGVTARGLADLRGILGRDDLALDPERLVAHGRDLVGLPERAPDAAEIEETARRLAALLGEGGLRPALVTIARSVEDGYTPREAWPAIEWALLRALAETLGPAEVRFDTGLGPAPAPPRALAPRARSGGPR